MQAFQYNNLGDIDDVDMVDESDLALFEEIRLVLSKHGKLNKFGINLLHRHFDVAEDECVVEYTDKEKRQLTAVVEKIGATPAVETMWRFDTDQAGFCVRQCHRRCAKWGSHYTTHSSGIHISST